MRNPPEPDLIEQLRAAMEDPRVADRRKRGAQAAREKHAAKRRERYRERKREEARERRRAIEGEPVPAPDGAVPLWVRIVEALESDRLRHGPGRYLSAAALATLLPSAQRGSLYARLSALAADGRVDFHVIDPPPKVLQRWVEPPGGGRFAHMRLEGPRYAYAVTAAGLAAARAWRKKQADSGASEQPRATNGQFLPRIPGAQAGSRREAKNSMRGSAKC